MPASVSRPVALIILDGWGYREERTANAIALANAPTWARIWATPSRTLLTASGAAVGLPEGQMGNSEVGHMNLGAGRVVMQDLQRITAAIADGSFFANAALRAACALASSRGTTLHLLGLIGDGGVHAFSGHLFALFDLARREGVPRVRLHAMLDGRDTPPTSGLEFLRTTLDRAHAADGDVPGRVQLATVSGRYFGMDRDARWPRVEKAYRAMVEGIGIATHDPLLALEAAYGAGQTDEFLEPLVCVNAAGAPVGSMRDGDVVLCFNFRSDRMRQLVTVLTSPSFDGFAVRERPSLSVTTMMQYDETFPFPVAFAPERMTQLVGEVIAAAGLTQLRTAETEKYPHVTYFFNGGRETPFAGEDRRLVPSPKVATYDLAPAMSAEGVCDGLCDALANRTHDFMLCNFANGDMVGHTGSLPAAIQAVEAVDACLARVLDAAATGGARLIITADHGNCDVMVDPVTGGPHTAHTTNPVPLVLIDPDQSWTLRSGGALCDVGPTVLGLLGVPQPAEMTGRDLRASVKGGA
ncbi:MAG: 2,3-bisphosphoglycerate-independent phosphoglycerate mutase [Gemmatimonadaceae bacterium]|nr:2,3-bisphosphoglycerate-independent phosphoglycerate mutase [Gemmatimonadaceae bacterium]